jgi:peptidylprolyl isomerase
MGLMRLPALAIVSVAGLMLVACGSGGSEEGGSSGGDLGARVIAITGPHGKLNVRIPPGRPPKRLVVRNLREGTGPAVESRKDGIVVNYAGLEFENGHEFYNSWDNGGVSRFILEETHPGWEIGLMGMKAGGLRELITPPKLEYGTTTIVYLIEMVKVRKAA